ncbi:hypothetical protein OC846_005430 [Tilletia horrida]|uniref:RNA-binding S4 domain-containing protein n=1 Tax=Tilletia horrida TaxID=155126 RepID=A0AAN6GKU3_9BASI|nr:hypothetical protein OC846_005430 [Tilletia horrida]KAK0567295.1 hypothetical protein OC861_002799 [Tilletia horrida]
MRKAKLFSHDAIIPRMSWSAHNLYNLIARSTVPFHVAGTDFSRTALTMYQQRWRAKRFIRGYHGDWIPERRFKRWFLPVDLPKLASSAGAQSVATSATHLPSAASTSALGARQQASSSSERARMPTASLFMSEVERRLDVVVFRCCFARSVYEARQMVVHGKVKLNGQKMGDPNRLLNPGDLITVAPDSVPMLSKVLRMRAQRREHLKLKRAGISANQGAQKKEEEAAAGEAEAEKEGSATAAEATKSEDANATEATEKPAQAAESSDASTEATSASSEASTSEQGGASTSNDKGKAKEQDSVGSPAAKSQQQQKPILPPGVHPFTLPAFAAPFLFVPSYLETSFSTCSAIYLRHPSIVPSSSRTRDRNADEGSPFAPSYNGSNEQVPGFLSEIPSPYPASGDIFSMAWEHYARTAPRVRGDLRRIQLKARVGVVGGKGSKEANVVGSAGGMERERAKIVWKRMRAVRKGWARGTAGPHGGNKGVPAQAGAARS